MARKNDDSRCTADSDALYRMLPSVNDLLLSESLTQSSLRNRRMRLVEVARTVLDAARDEIAQGLHSAESLKKRIDDLPVRVVEEIERNLRFSLRRVINATGVILHTNLGRAPLSQPAIDHLQDVACGYSNLEFDLEQGERGKRDVHVEKLLLALLGKAASADFTTTHRAIVVNNCAAATFLALHAVARGKQVLVSRAELVEIGGGFRIPEILEESGARLREVGTTNRTRIADYERGLTAETGVILRVHQSNFAIEGYVERPELAELIALGRRARTTVFEDQGTGLIESLESSGIRGEATFAGSVALGCDLVAASGDKLLGGPQCGILAGKKELIDLIRSNPLYRTFRADKLNYAALEATLIQYLYGDPESVPVIRMLRMPEDRVRSRCEYIANSPHHRDFAMGVIRTESVIGGGTAPKSKLASCAIALKHTRLDASRLLRALRRLDPPIIGRIENDRVLLDLRTVEPEFDEALVKAFSPSLDFLLSAGLEGR